LQNPSGSETWFVARQRRQLVGRELASLRRQPRWAPNRPVDRAFLAALARALPRSAWSGLSARRRRFCAGTGSWSGGAGGIRTDLRGGCRSIVGCSARCSAARENPSWSYRRSSADCQASAFRFSATSVRTILIRRGLPPAPQRDQLSWRNFRAIRLRRRSAAVSFAVETAWLKRICVLFFPSMASHRIEFVACLRSGTATPTSWAERDRGCLKGNATGRFVPRTCPQKARRGSFCRQSA
jgi:putative transposase